MKAILKYKLSGLILLCIFTIAIAGCEKKQNYVVSPIGGNNESSVTKVYMTQALDNPVTRDVQITFTDKTPTIQYGASIQEGKKSSEKSISVKFNADPSLVNDYNSKNGVNYKVLPEDSYELTQETSEIPAGQTKTSEYNVDITTGGYLNDSTKYLLPIKVSVNGGNDVQIVDKYQTAYFVIQGKYIPFSKDGWAINDFGDNLGSLYDGTWIIDDNEGSNWLTVQALPHKFQIDMGEKHTISGFKLVGNSGSYATYYTRNPKKVTFKFSNDGNTFNKKEIHFTLPFTPSPSDPTTIKVYLDKPVKARYFQFIINTTVGGQGVANFNEIYAF